MSNVFNALSNLRNNIFGPSKIGVTGAPSSFPPKRTPIELQGDQGPLESLNRDPFSGNFLSYPSNLINDVSIGHYIIFFMNVQNRTRFPYVDKDGVKHGPKIIETVTEDTSGAAGQVVRKAGDEVIREGAVEGAQQFQSDFFKDKYVLIGASAQGLFDLVKTPLGLTIPGVEVHANVIENILDKSYLIRNPNTYVFELLFSIIVALITFFLSQKIKSSMKV